MPIGISECLKQSAFKWSIGRHHKSQILYTLLIFLEHMLLLCICDWLSLRTCQVPGIYYPQEVLSYTVCIVFLIWELLLAGMSSTTPTRELHFQVSSFNIYTRVINNTNAPRRFGQNNCLFACKCTGSTVLLMYAQLFKSELVVIGKRTTFSYNIV